MHTPALAQCERLQARDKVPRFNASQPAPPCTLARAVELSGHTLAPVTTERAVTPRMGNSAAVYPVRSDDFVRTHNGIGAAPSAHFGHFALNS